MNAEQERVEYTRRFLHDAIETHFGSCPVASDVEMCEHLAGFVSDPAWLRAATGLVVGGPASAEGEYAAAMAAWDAYYIHREAHPRATPVERWTAVVRAVRA